MARVSVSCSNPSKNLETLFQRRIRAQEEEPVVGFQGELRAWRDDRFPIADGCEKNRAPDRSQLQLAQYLAPRLPIRPDRDELDVRPAEGLVQPLGRHVGSAEAPEGVLPGTADFLRLRLDPGQGEPEPPERPPGDLQ